MKGLRKVLMCAVVFHIVVAYGLLRCSALGGDKRIAAIGMCIYVILCIKYMFSLDATLSGQMVRKGADGIKCLLSLMVDLLLFLFHCAVVGCFFVAVYSCVSRDRLIVGVLLAMHIVVHCFMTCLAVKHTCKTGVFIPCLGKH